MLIPAQRHEFPFPNYLISARTFGNQYNTIRFDGILYRSPLDLQEHLGIVRELLEEEEQPFHGFHGAVT